MQTPEPYILFITALLPLTAGLLLLQVNPYRALVMRAIVGAIATLLYTVLGAADVALTEALVGTLLAMLLYSITVRSSMVFRLGVLRNPSSETFNTLAIAPLKTILSKYHLRLRVVLYEQPSELTSALAQKEIHATCLTDPEAEEPTFHTQIRVPRLYELLKNEPLTTRLELVALPPEQEKK
jgi:putative multicomponent Na+:H+ antiporter subunit B